MPAALAPDDAAARIAATIGEPARARMLYCLLDDRARTSTELAMIAGVSPSTASAHLNKLKAESLVRVLVQGKHRYYSLENSDVASVLEALNVLAGVSSEFVPGTPSRLRAARTCYDHLAGALGVALHDRLFALGWLANVDATDDNSCDVTTKGTKGLVALGIEVGAMRGERRRFAYACLDWSERRAHLGGALGAALFQVALRKRWVAQDRDSRVVRVTALGHRDMRARFGLVATTPTSSTK